MAQLRFAESAERDLMDIGNFIGRDSPAGAGGSLHGSKSIANYWLLIRCSVGPATSLRQSYAASLTAGT
jgi:hypothetical protein